MTWLQHVRPYALGLVLAAGAGSTIALAGNPVVEEVDAPRMLTPAESTPTLAEPAQSPKTPSTRQEVPANAPTEVIQERYPNRNVKIERHVAQDTAGNYVNHGPWAMWDEAGRLLARGEFQNGLRHGEWVRWYAPNEGEMFTAPLYKQFQGPFSATASFQNDKLHGAWIVSDSKKRKCSEWYFENGDRQGKSYAYYPTGNKMSEAEYKNGQLEGESLHWGPDGKLTQQDTFRGGRRLGTKTDFFEPGAKRFEGEYLFGRPILDTNYDFWNGIVKVTTAGKETIDLRNGPWTSWFRNGQKQMEGRYAQEVPEGPFTWWYSNGQKAITGEYTAGKQTGNWTWWHENGQKKLGGTFEQGVPVNKWTWWNENGRVTKTADMTLEQEPPPAVTLDPQHELHQPSHEPRGPAKSVMQPPLQLHR